MLKKYIIIPAFLVSCGESIVDNNLECLSNQDCLSSSEETTVDENTTLNIEPSDNDLVSERKPLAWEPFIDAGETADQCCPLLADGRVLNEFCGADGSNDTCPSSMGYVTGWSASGSTVVGWRIVNCFTCGVNSCDPSLRWVAVSGHGNICQGTSTRKYTAAIVDDQCTADCNYYFDDCDPDAAWCITPGDLCSTRESDGSVMAMCCDGDPPNVDWTDCYVHDESPQDHDCEDVISFQGAHHQTLAWCYPCPYYASSHDTKGAWDFNPFGIYNNQYEKWRESTVCQDFYPPINSETLNAFPIRHECGGYLISAEGELLHNNCY